jgi:hypothetical protein
MSEETIDAWGPDLRAAHQNPDVLGDALRVVLVEVLFAGCLGDLARALRRSFAELGQGPDHERDRMALRVAYRNAVHIQHADTRCRELEEGRPAGDIGDWTAGESSSSTAP